MSIPYVANGRTRQKLRTRDALLEAARTLVTQGETPTVESAAAAASISRTTAYRYFSNQRALLVAAHPETTAEFSLLPGEPPDDPEARLDAVIARFTRLVAETDAQQRTMLRLSLEPHAADHEPGLLRQGRAIRWIEEALAPLADRMSRNELRRLVLAIRSATGIEARVWLMDVAGLSSGQAINLMRDSARALYRAAIAEHPKPLRRSGK